jgi:hypothetical protein
LKDCAKEMHEQWWSSSGIKNPSAVPGATSGWTADEGRFGGDVEGSGEFFAFSGVHLLFILVCVEFGKLNIGAQGLGCVDRSRSRIVTN